MKVPVDGSAPPMVVTRAEGDWGQPALLESGDQLITVRNGLEYIRLSAQGGPPSKPMPFGSKTFTELSGGLPGDRGVLLVESRFEGTTLQQSVGVLDLKSGKSRILIPDAGSPSYSTTGHLLFTRRDVLLAAPFDLSRLEIKGQPVAILDGLRVPSGWVHAPFQITRSGALLYLLGGDISKDRQPVIVGADGTISEWSSERGPYQLHLNASPDGARFASHMRNNGIYEIWVAERGSMARRTAASAGASCMIPAWSPDGRQIAYTQSNQTEKDGIYVTDADGTSTPRRIRRTTSELWLYPVSWSPRVDDLLLVGYRNSLEGELFLIDMSRDEQDPKPIFTQKGNRSWGAFSPDGRLIAYVSNETGRNEVFVSVWDEQGRRPTGQPAVVSRGGGDAPRWGRDGKRLYFTAPQRKVMSSAIARAPKLAASSPAVAWDLDALGLAEALDERAPFYDVLPDGRLLAIRRGPEESELTRYDIALNFDEELKAKLRK